jgi:heptosyltransferase-2
VSLNELNAARFQNGDPHTDSHADPQPLPLGENPELTLSEPQRIAVFCPNWVGDLVMATPALRALRNRFPQAEITAVLRPSVQEVLEGTALVDQVVAFTTGRTLPGYHSVAFARRLRSERFDLAVLFPNSFRSAWWAWVSGAKRRVGFDRYGRGMLMTDRLQPRPLDVPHPVMDEYLRLAAHVGCHPLPRRMELATTFDNERAYRQFWDKRGGWPHEGIVCLNPGGAFGAAKHWPVTSFAELALRIATELGKRVLVLCGPAEAREAREIAFMAHHPRVVSLAGAPLSIGLTKAAVKHAELLITTDSGPRHFAPPFEVPVVTLYGPTHVEWSNTHYDQAIHLQLQMECGPCQQRVCPLQHHHCMRDLSPSWAFKAAVSLLERKQKRKAA